MINTRLVIIAVSMLIFLFNSMETLKGSNANVETIFLEVYCKNSSIKILDKHISIIKERFIEKNNKKAANDDEILSFIKQYCHIYADQRDENINRKFIDTIFPVIFRNNFLIIEEKHYFDNILSSGAQNPYLMSYYYHRFFDDNISVFYKKFSQHYPNNSYFSFILNQAIETEFILKGKYCSGKSYEENSNYLKTILIPPTESIAKTAKKILPTLMAFMCCMKEISKKKYKLPGLSPQVIKRVIIPFIIKRNIPEKQIKRYETMNQIIDNDWINIQNALNINNKNEGKEKSVSYEDFNTWMEKHVHPASLIFNTIEMRMNEKK